VGAATLARCYGRSMTQRTLHALGALATLVVASRVDAQGIRGPLPNVGPPLLLRLEGKIETSPDAARRTGFAVVSLGFPSDRSAQRWLGVTEARTFGGDQFLDGKDVLALVAPFSPNLLVVGPEKQVSALRDAPPGTDVRVEGLVDRGARTYYLRKVELGANANG